MRPLVAGSSMVCRRCLAAAWSSEPASSTCSTIRRPEIAEKARTLRISSASSRRRPSRRRRARRRGGGRRRLLCGAACGTGPGGGGGRRRPRGGRAAVPGPRPWPGDQSRPAFRDQAGGGGLAGDAGRGLEAVDLRLEAGPAALGGAAVALEPAELEGLLVDADVEGHEAEHADDDHGDGEQQERQARGAARPADGAQAGRLLVAVTRGAGWQVAHRDTPSAWPLGGSFSAARSLALSERGLAATSSAVGVSGRRVSTATLATCGTATGNRGGTSPARPAAAARVRLTMRPSREW